MSKYKIVESKEPEKYAIQIESGEFAGIKYNYDKVKIVEDEENDQAVVQFDFTIEEGNQTHSIESLENNNDFEQEIGNILIQVFEENLQSDGDSNKDGIDIVVDENV